MVHHPGKVKLVDQVAPDLDGGPEQAAEETWAAQFRNLDEHILRLLRVGGKEAQILHGVGLDIFLANRALSARRHDGCGVFVWSGKFG